MAVLLFVCAFVFLFFLLFFMFRINIYTFKKLDYEYFTFGYFGAFATINLLLYFGKDWYEEALKMNGDILNGILLMSFAVMLLIYILYVNIRTSSFLFGILITALQAAMYFPFTIVLFPGAIFIFGFFSQVSEYFEAKKRGRK
ncbi:hypothetical protein [Poseidonibacter lekithochrous]|uniref:hypothetical protein n=1 Tax=Poseidonibacter lekithochrous TaxID=1904463 RepID=UPI0008FC3B3D|nr:hypothetical protein [Poseidonibacter lekithochrous]QKJ22310.1 hypothetical protein ALEK_1030 [Poseidonibacter lekithochrous]